MDNLEIVKIRVNQVLSDNPLLNDHGNGRSYSMPVASIDGRGLRLAILAEREKLRSDSSIRDIIAAHAWIVVNMRESRGICKTYSSYGLKHVMESDNGVYVSNGAFCVAMILAGYKMGIGFNPSFNIMRSSVESVIKRTNKRGRVTA